MLKWSLAQLFKYNHKTFEFEDTLDFKDRIVNIDDILDISDVYVEGNGRNLVDDRYIFNLKIKCLLTLECARTLEAVDFPIDLEVCEIFDTVEASNEDIRLIERNTIDLSDVIWENIYLEKPMRVFKEDSVEFIDDQNLDDFFDEED